MQAHEERVIAEKAELEAKREKLQAFLGSDKFKTLSDEQQDLLLWQNDAMNDYSDALAARIKRFAA